MNTTEANKRIIRRAIDEIHNQGDFSVLEELIGEEYVSHYLSEPKPLQGREDFRTVVTHMRQALTGYHVRIDDQLAAGDKVVTRWSMRGRHDGELFGIPPCGNEVEISAISIERLAGGRIVEEWYTLDRWDFLRQAGSGPDTCPVDSSSTVPGSG